MTIKSTDAVVTPSSEERLVHFVMTTPKQVPHRMATQGISAKQGHIHGEHERADAHSELHGSCRWIREPQRFPDVVGKNEEEDHGDIHKITMDILNDQRKFPLAAVVSPRLTHAACRRGGPQCFVITSTIVIAGESETS